MCGRYSWFHCSSSIAFNNTHNLVKESILSWILIIIQYIVQVMMMYIIYRTHVWTLQPDSRCAALISYTGVSDNSVGRYPSYVPPFGLSRLSLWRSDVLIFVRALTRTQCVQPKGKSRAENRATTNNTQALNSVTSHMTYRKEVRT